MGNQETVKTQLELKIDSTNTTRISKPAEPTSNISSPVSNQKGAYDQLNQFFADQNQEQRSILEAREILGDSAADISDEQVYELITEVQYLVDTWIEEFERNVFDGKTLQELLQLNL